MSLIAPVLKEKRKQLGLSVRTVAAQLHRWGIEVSEKTVYSWESGHRQPDADTLLALCRIYKIQSLSTFFSEETSEFSVKEQNHIKKYRALDGYGKEAVDTILDVEYKRCAAAQPAESDEEEGNIIELDFPYQAASAGAGDYADDTAHEKLAVRLNENTRRADYLMRVNGDSMEPKYQDGDILLVHSQPSVEEGEVGIFIINGDRLVKQQGAGELISLNPQYPNIPLSESDSVYCKGKVIGVLSPEDML